MKKTLALLLVLVLCVGMLAGCGAKKEEPAAAAAEAPKAAEPAKAAEAPKAAEPAKAEEPKEFVYYYVRSSEESVLNPHDANAESNYNIVDLITLTPYNYRASEDGMTAVMTPYAAAEEPVTTDGGYTWHIKFKDNLKWANGDKIDAHTFEYSYKMGMDPKLFWESAYSGKNYFEIKNAVAYKNQLSTGVEVKWEDVGVKAIDDLTLEIVSIEKTTAINVMRQHYLRSAGPVYEPIYSKCISEDGTKSDYGSSMDKFMCSGRFKVDSWNKGAEVIMSKNPYDPWAEDIHIDKIISRVVSDESTRVEMFEKGEASSLTLGTNGMAKYGEDPRVLSYDSKTIHTLEVNQNHTTKEWLKDPAFRKAIFYAIDRASIAKLTQTTPANFFLSTSGIAKADGTMYRDTAEAQAVVEKYAGTNYGYDPELAKKYLDEVLAKYKLDKLSFNITYTEGSDSRRAASERLQSELTRIFGEDKVEITLSSMTSTLLLSTMRSSTKSPVDTWDLAWSGWGLAAETFFPYMKFEKYTSTVGNRYTNYKNETVNELIKQAMDPETKLDEEKELQLTAQMEAAMFEDMTCIPVFQAKSFMMYDEKLVLPMKRYQSGIGFGWTFAKLK